MKGLLQLEQLKDCLEGIVPSCVATCDAEGMPNVTYVSQAMYVDSQHIALSFQFFNKTRENILMNSIATLLMTSPLTAARYRLSLHYLRTETSGPLFERMRAKLAGIASHEGLVGVFVLKGADIYRVLSVEHVPGRELTQVQATPELLPALRQSVEALVGCSSLEQVLDVGLVCLDRYFQIKHAIVLVADPCANKLFTVASRGYKASGVDSEIPYGVGLIGVAAQHRVPIRSMFAAVEYNYTRAVREQAIANGQSAYLEDRIPMPGLAEPATQMAVPIVNAGHLLGVLYVESELSCRFGYDGEDALVALCCCLGAIMAQLRAPMVLSAVLENPVSSPKQNPTYDQCEQPVSVRYFPHDHSVFLDQDYLIKGVAGAILWRLLEIHNAQGRCEFSNRELRLDTQVPLPDFSDNLDARLLLLTRRLKDRSDVIALERFSRGKLRLTLKKSVVLQKLSKTSGQL